MTLQENINKLGQVIRKHAPEILTGVSVAGLGASVYLGAKAGFKSGLIASADMVDKTLADLHSDEPIEPMPTKQLIKETWKFYIPTAIVVVVTGAAIVGNHKVNANRNLALISAAAISEQAFREYRDKIVETTSKPKERKVQADIAQDRINEKNSDLSKLLADLNHGDVLCMESYTGRVFISTAEKIHKAENEIGRRCINENSASHNEFMTLLGLPWVDSGEAVGWNNDNPIEVIIDAGIHEDHSGKSHPVLSVGYVNPPSVKYNAIW